VLDKPVVQYAVEEARAAGIEGIRIRHRRRQGIDRQPFSPAHPVLRGACSRRKKKTTELKLVRDLHPAARRNCASSSSTIRSALGHGGSGCAWELIGGRALRP